MDWLGIIDGFAETVQQAAAFETGSAFKGLRSMMTGEGVHKSK
jgi:hypothetical protein